MTTYSNIILVIVVSFKTAVLVRHNLFLVQEPCRPRCDSLIKPSTPPIMIFFDNLGREGLNETHKLWLLAQILLTPFPSVTLSRFVLLKVFLLENNTWKISLLFFSSHPFRTENVIVIYSWSIITTIMAIRFISSF